MNQVSYIKDHFLIAMPNLSDPHFFHSVTYICEHNEEGAMGIVINHPLDISVSDLLDHLEIAHENESLHDQAVLAGGPVQPERGFVVHRPGGQWQSTLESSPEIHVTTSRDVLVAIAEGNGPADMIMALGYAGWDAGQLEEELSGNTWLSCAADPKIFFNTPAAHRWQAAARLLGIDVSQLSNDVGHA